MPRIDPATGERIDDAAQGGVDPSTGERMQPQSQSSKGALVGQGIAASIQPLAAGAAEFATNPNVPRIAAQAGRVIGGVAPAIGGAIEAGPMGGIVGLAAAAKGAWAGGKTGWFTGKLAQNIAAPVATALDALKPYAQALSTVSGAQGALDLAQMAEPTRRDIGVLGVGRTVPVPSDARGPNQAKAEADFAAQGGKQMSWGDLASKIKDAARALKNEGVPAAEDTVIKILSDGNEAIFGRLKSLYHSGRF